MAGDDVQLPAETPDQSAAEQLDVDALRNELAQMRLNDASQDEQKWLDAFGASAAVTDVSGSDADSDNDEGFELVSGTF